MLYLLWALINIGIFVFFLIICFKATRFIREKMGLIAAIVFVIGLLSFVASPSNDNVNQETGSNPGARRSWKFASEQTIETYSTRFAEVKLQSNLVSSYRLLIVYGIEKQGQVNIPINASSMTNGLVSGTIWKPEGITVNRTNDNNKFEYIVNGTVDWKLLGAVIFSQSKHFKGIATVK